LPSVGDFKAAIPFCRLAMRGIWGAYSRLFVLTAPFALATVGDALRWFGLDRDRRLRTFLDMQLKLYSQVEAEETALLYAATALGVSQAPQGLYHLQGSMQVLSDRLVMAFERDGGQLMLRHAVEHIDVEQGQCRSVHVKNLKTGETCIERADTIVANVTVHNAMKLMGNQAPVGYRYRVDKLPTLSGAFVVYLGVDQQVIPEGCPMHLQFLYDDAGPIAENNSLFVSVSRPGDGRAPDGYATIIASSFTDPRQWWQADEYDALKERYTQQAIAQLQTFFPRLKPDRIRHQEAATPRTFAYYTARDQGVVGGVGQRLSTFGPFGFANRTPIPGLWLVGDSTHPGEGTAGVSYSAWTTVQQIEALS
jgi:C-3',4' desaturase CrtD